MKGKGKKKTGLRRRRKTKIAAKATASRSQVRKRIPVARNESAALTYDKVKTLVAENSKSAGLSDQCVIAVCWKESSFDPSAKSPTSTAKGLMQMTNPAVDTVNRITPTGIHFEYADMLDAAKAIQCGTYYVQWCYEQVGSDESKGLDRYAGVPGYATNVIAAEACLRSGGDPTACLKKIHPFLIERKNAGLIDDESGKSRFTKPPKK